MRKRKCPGDLLWPGADNPELVVTHIVICNWAQWRWWLEQEFPEEMAGIKQRLPEPLEGQRTPDLESSYQELNDRDWLHQRYHTDGLTMEGIARLLGCSKGAVQHAMRIHAIKGRRKGPRRKKRPEPDPELVERARHL